jgi:chromosome segregation ATPase
VFEQLFAQMEEELAKKKQAVQQQSDLIEAAYHARDQAQIEMNELRTEMERTKAEIESEWAELDSMLADLGQTAEDSTAVPETKLGDMTIEEEAKLRQDVKSGTATLQRDQQAVIEARQRLTEFETTWAEIQQRTGVESFEALVKIFSEFEDQVGPARARAHSWRSA